MLNPKWRELTAAYVANQQSREKKLADIKEALWGLSAKPKLSDFIAFVAKLKELVK